MVTSLCGGAEAQFSFCCWCQSHKPSPSEPKDNINIGPTAFPSCIDTLFCLLQPRSCCHVRDSFHTGNGGVQTVNVTSNFQIPVVLLALPSYLHKLWHCSFAYFLSPFWWMFWNWACERTPWAFCCTILSQSLLSANVLVKCFNVSFQYVLLTLLSAGNCWDIDLGRKKIYTVFSF